VAFKIRQNPFSAGALVPDPAGGAYDALPDPLVGWRGDTPPHMPPHSTRTHRRRSIAMRPPRSPARSTPMLISSSAVAERPPCRVGQLWTNVEDWNWETIFYRHYRSIFNHCDI